MIFTISYTGKGYAEENNVSLDVFLSGNGSYDGIFQYQMVRTYTNKTNEIQVFSESFQLGVNDNLNVGFVQLVNIADELTFENLGNGSYQISGRLQPKEAASITIFKQTDGLSRGGSSSATTYGDRFLLLSSIENIMPRVFTIKFKYPADIYKITDLTSLNVTNLKGEMKRFTPSRLEGNLPMDSWYITNEDELINEDEFVRKIDFKNVDGVDLELAYQVRLNTTPTYLIYIAIGIASLSLLFSVLLSVRLSKLKKSNKEQPF